MAKSSSITAAGTATHAGTPKVFEETPAASFRCEGDRYRPYRKDQPDEHGIENDVPEVARPTPLPPKLLRAARRSQFPRRHRRKHRAEGDKAHQRFV